MRPVIDVRPVIDAALSQPPVRDELDGELAELMRWRHDDVDERDATDDLQLLAALRASDEEAAAA
jgi:hypothetical protein